MILQTCYFGYLGHAIADCSFKMVKEKVNKKGMCEILASEVMWHENCRRLVSDLTYPSCEFSECDNDTNDDNSNSNYNDDNNTDNSSGNTDNKNKNINNGNIHFCNS